MYWLSGLSVTGLCSWLSLILPTPRLMGYNWTSPSQGMPRMSLSRGCIVSGASFQCFWESVTKHWGWKHSSRYNTSWTYNRDLPQGQQRLDLRLTDILRILTCKLNNRGFFIGLMASNNEFVLERLDKNAKTERKQDIFVYLVIFGFDVMRLSLERKICLYFSNGYHTNMSRLSLVSLSNWTWCTRCRIQLGGVTTTCSLH